MRIILSILLSLNPASARTTAVSNPIVFSTPVESTVIAAKDYEDIRVDSDRDQKIDLWVIKSKGTTVSVTFKNGRASLFNISKSAFGRIQEAEYKLENGIFKLASSADRLPEVMNGTGVETTDAEVCRKENSSVLEKLTQFTEELKARELVPAAAKAISCDNDEAAGVLENSLFTILKSDRLSDCMSSEKILSQVKAEDRSYLIYVSNKLKLDLKRIAHQQDGENLIKCEEAPSDSKLSAKYHEQGNIVVKVPKDIKSTKIESTSRALLYHELLHRAGLSDEGSTDLIINTCLENKVARNIDDTKAIAYVKANAEKAANSQQVAATVAKSDVSSAVATTKTKASRSLASTANETGGGASGYNMKKEIAAAEVQQSMPSAEKLAVQPVSTSDEATRATVVESQRTSAPVLAMADRAMGVMNTPALASNDSSSSSGTSSTRSSGDRYQVRHPGYESDSSRTKSSDNTDLSKMIYKPSRNGGTVVEEVDLTKRSSASASSETTGRTTSANSRGIASTGSAASATAQGGSDEVAGSSGGGGGFSSGSGGGGSGTFYADKGSGSTRKTNAENRRGVASKSTGSAVETSRDEVITFISNANYTQTKSKLREQSFQKTLSNNQISIIYADGSDPIGAQRGTTVFLDDGSRFIMQRRK